ncbi:MAG: cytochrome P450 [Chloroflexota bacterium]
MTASTFTQHKTNGSNDVTVNKAKPSTIPTVRGNFLLGNLNEFRNDTLGLFTRVMHEHGDIAKVYYGPKPAYHITHPDYVKHVLVDNNRNYKRAESSSSVLRMLLGENIISSEGDYWRRQRRIMQPVFHRKRIDGFSNIMIDNTAKMLDQWAQHPKNQPLDVDHEMMAVTLAIVGRALFGVDLTDDAGDFGEAMTANNKYFSYRLSNLFAPPLWVPTKRNRRFKQITERTADLIPNMIAERRQDIATNGTAHETGRQYDLLDLLLEARYEDTREGMSDAQLNSETQVMIGAGHETTSMTLSWTLYLLSQHPEIEAKLHAEIDAVLGDRLPTLDALDKLVYNKMVIQESMRKYPAAWAVSREALTPDTIGGYDIPAGVPVLVPIHAIHHNPALWDNPDTFDPERFAPDKAKTYNRFAYFPFGGGPRQCIGMGFAMMEAQLLLAMIVQRFRLRLVPKHPVEPWPLITLRMKYGLQMTLEVRR